MTCADEDARSLAAVSPGLTINLLAALFARELHPYRISMTIVSRQSTQQEWNTWNNRSACPSSSASATCLSLPTSPLMGSVGICREILVGGFAVDQSKLFRYLRSMSEPFHYLTRQARVTPFGRNSVAEVRRSPALVRIESIIGVSPTANEMASPAVAPTNDRGPRSRVTSLRRRGISG
jgi:hypothetical protein